MRKTIIDIYDAHLHMGFLSDNEVILPSYLNNFIQKHNVCGGTVMPTASVGGYDDFNLHCELYRKASIEGFSSILYITPEIIKQLENDSVSKLNFCRFVGVKIHTDAMNYSNEELSMLVEFAIKHHLPVFIHTGGKYSCESKRFEFLIAQHIHQVFVLCHARPAEQAFNLLNHYTNVWIDTAFLPVEDLKIRINEINQKRILFGTDFPINRWYSDLPEDNEWYESIILSIKSNLSSGQARDILSYNYQRFIKKYTKLIKL